MTTQDKYRKWKFGKLRLEQCMNMSIVNMEDMLLHILTQILSSILQANIFYHCLPWYQLEK